MAGKVDWVMVSTLSLAATLTIGVIYLIVFLILNDKAINNQAILGIKEYEVVATNSGSSGKHATVLVGGELKYGYSVSSYYVVILKDNNGIIYKSTSQELYSACKGNDKISLGWKEYKGELYTCLDNEVVDLEKMDN